MEQEGWGAIVPIIYHGGPPGYEKNSSILFQAHVLGNCYTVSDLFRYTDEVNAGSLARNLVPSEER